MKAKQTANMHAKRYVDEVFSKRLIEEGFVCPDDKHLCWYRLCGENIVNSIIFYSCWNSLPIFLEIGYGIHPLFRKPAHTSSIHYANKPVASELFFQQPIVENVPINSMEYSCYSTDIQVLAPGIEGRGIYTFDGIILPIMNSIRTIEDCYEFHKQQYLSNGADSKYQYLSGLFIDEAIYVDDIDVYPYCRTRIESMIKRYQNDCTENPMKKEYQVVKQEWEQRRDALLSGARIVYIATLEKRLRDNLWTFKKKIGIAD